MKLILSMFFAIVEGEKKRKKRIRIDRHFQPLDRIGNCFMQLAFANDEVCHSKVRSRAGVEMQKL